MCRFQDDSDISAGGHLKPRCSSRVYVLEFGQIVYLLGNLGTPTKLRATAKKGSLTYLPAHCNKTFTLCDRISQIMSRKPNALFLFQLVIGATCKWIQRSYLYRIHFGVAVCFDLNRLKVSVRIDFSRRSNSMLEMPRAFQPAPTLHATFAF